jgi:hypothetical protein
MYVCLYRYRLVMAKRHWCFGSCDNRVFAGADFSPKIRDRRDTDEY